MIEITEKDLDRKAPCSILDRSSLDQERSSLQLTSQITLLINSSRVLSEIVRTPTVSWGLITSFSELFRNEIDSPSQDERGSTVLELEDVCPVSRLFYRQICNIIFHGENTQFQQLTTQATLQNISFSSNMPSLASVLGKMTLEISERTNKDPWVLSSIYGSKRI